MSETKTRRGRTVDCICGWRGCRKPFKVRAADVRRGWGKFCNKSCKAKEQESRTGQHAEHQRKLRQQAASGDTGGRSTAYYLARKESEYGHHSDHYESE